jgi:hypothetical protein
MKKQIVCMLLVAMLSALAGCQVPGDPDHYQKLTASVNKTIDAVGDVGDKVIDAMRKYEVVPAEKLDKIEVAITSIAEPINALQDASTVAAKAYDEKIQENDPIGGWLKVGEIVAGLLCPEAALLVGAAGIGLAKYKSGKLAISDNKYEAHKQGAEAFMRHNAKATNNDVSNELYNEIGKARQRNGVT